MTDLQPYYNLIEEVIKGLGIDPVTCRNKDKAGNVVVGQWNLTLGSASIYVDVFDNVEGNPYVNIGCPIMEVSTSNLLGLYEKLLTINYELYAAAFSINKGWVWLKIIRECEGLDIKEASAMFWRVGNYSDDWDDKLKAEFPPAA